MESPDTSAVMMADAQLLANNKCVWVLNPMVNLGERGLDSLTDLKVVKCHSTPGVKNCLSARLQIRLLICSPLRVLKLLGVRRE